MTSGLVIGGGGQHQTYNYRGKKKSVFLIVFKSIRNMFKKKILWDEGDPEVDLRKRRKGRSTGFDGKVLTPKGWRYLIFLSTHDAMQTVFCRAIIILHTIWSENEKKKKCKNVTRPIRVCLERFTTPTDGKRCAGSPPKTHLVGTENDLRKEFALPSLSQSRRLPVTVGKKEHHVWKKGKKTDGTTRNNIFSQTRNFWMAAKYCVR